MIEAISGPGKLSRPVEDTMEGLTVGRSFPLDDGWKQKLCTGRLSRVPEGIQHLLTGIPGSARTVLDRPFNRNEIFSMGFVWEKALYGSAVIIPLEKAPIGKTLLAEILGNQASAALHRQHTQGQLKSAHDRNRVPIEGQTLFRVFSERSGEGISLADGQGNYIFVNSVFCNMTGYSEPELLKMNVRDLKKKGTRPKLFPKILNNGSGYLETELIRKDGSLFFADIIGTKIKIGDQPLILGIIRDISDQKQLTDTLKKNEERFKFLAENMGDIVWTLDMNFNATYVSPSVEKILGYTVEERKRQKLEEMVTPETFERIMATFIEEMERDKIAGVDTDRSIHIEVEYFHKNGSIVWMENIIKAIRDDSGSIIGMYGVSRDITGRKKAEQEKEKLIKELKDALNEIKTLSGLLPICSGCKKIRDDRGYWNYLESYIEQHSDALFSHSVCPECADRLYGDQDWYRAMKQGKKRKQ